MQKWFERSYNIIAVTKQSIAEKNPMPALGMAVVRD